jgi:flagellar biosynthetic protein FliQ
MMNSTSVLTLIENALEVGVLVSAPLLLSALAMGLLVSLFQAATQINEMTLSFIPKLLVLVLVMLIGGPWMLGIMLDYMQRLFTAIPSLIG